ncbi:MAG: peptidoglycan-binding protein [Bacteroidota bacterium]
MLENIKSLIKNDQVEEVLKRSSTYKEAIQALQSALYHLGFGKELKWAQFGADGDYGGATAAAVVAFAAKHNIQTDGNSVSKTLAEKLILHHETIGALQHLKEALDANAIGKLKKKSPEKDLVTSLQVLLNSLGFGTQMNWEKFGADGDFGGGTAKAVKAFAEQENLQSTGEEVDEILAAKILEKFIPFLGEGWAEARATKRHQRRQKKGQYFLLFPKGKRNFKGIESIRKEPEKEFYKKVNGEEIWRIYRYEFEKGEHEIEGEKLSMEYYEVKKFNSDGKRIMSFCYPEDHEDNQPKDRIVLHFTAGQTLGDIKTLSREDHHISTAYILGRDGSIYRLFSPKQWSYHLGRGVPGGNTAHSARSIGIEISNYGWLEKSGENLIFSGGHRYCSLDDEKAYHKLPHPFIEKEYYASYTKRQYEGLIILLRYLTKKFNIEKTFLPTDTSKEATGNWREIPRYAVFKDKETADNFRGICSHVNYRASGKWDIGPAFDWERVIQGVSAEKFTPSFASATRSLLSSAPIRTEEEMLTQTRGMNYGESDTSIYGEDGPEVDI